MLATLFDVEMEAPPMRVAVEPPAMAVRVEAIALACDDDEFAAVLLEEVYEPVLTKNELNDTLAGAFKLDARIGNWHEEDPQVEALTLARELEAGFS